MSRFWGFSGGGETIVLELGIWGLVVLGLGLWELGFGIRVWSLGFGVWESAIRVAYRLGLWFIVWAWGLGASG